MTKKQEYEACIDTFIYTEYPRETPAYQAIMRERVLDLCNRNIKPDEAGAYLKSGGWSSDFATIYNKFLEYCKHNQEDDMEEKEISLPLAQVQLLLFELLKELAATAGFRAPATEEDAKEYRKQFEAFLTSRVSGVAEDQLKLLATEISERANLIVTYLESK